MSYWTRRKKSASERGKRMAARRWELDRDRRERLAVADPIKFDGHIVRRIIVIDDERRVREITIYDFDSFREVKRKQRRILEVAR